MIDPSLVNERLMAVDIGLNGGAALNYGEVLWLQHIEPCDMIGWITDSGRVVAEDVHAFAKQGVTSTGTLLEQKGFLRGACMAKGVPLELIQPLKWIECYTMKRSKHFKTKTEWKKHLLEIAKSIAPDYLTPNLTLKTADAFLIWNYAAAKEIGAPLEKMGLQLKLL